MSERERRRAITTSHTEPADNSRTGNIQPYDLIKITQVRYKPVRSQKIDGKRDDGCIGYIKSYHHIMEISFGYKNVMQYVK